MSVIVVNVIIPLLTRLKIQPGVRQSFKSAGLQLPRRVSRWVLAIELVVTRIDTGVLSGFVALIGETSIGGRNKHVSSVHGRELSAAVQLLFN